MAAHQPRKNLKIGIFRGKEAITEEVVKKHQSLTFGKGNKNTFFVPSASVPESIELLAYNSDTGKYTLKVPVGTRGKVRLSENENIDLEQLSSNSTKNARIKDGKIYVLLPETARGKVTFGKITILFQFVIVRNDAGKILAADKQRLKFYDIVSPGFFYPLLFSFLLHIGFLAFVMVQDWPRDDESLASITRFLREADLKPQIDTEDKEPEPEPEVVEDPTAEPSGDIADAEPDAGDAGADRGELMERITDAHREAGAAITAQILGIDGGDAGDYFGAMLGSSAAIADMSDASASDIGVGGTAGLLNSLTNSNTAGSGNGLLNIGDGEGSSGPRVVVNGNDAKKNTDRKKIEYKMSDSSEFTASAPAGSKEQINAVFKKKQNDIKTCYQRVINAQGKASGRLVVTVSIGKDGIVMKVDKVEDQIGGEMFSCVRQRIMNYKFGQQKSPIVFRKTWVFN